MNQPLSYLNHTRFFFAVFLFGWMLIVGFASRALADVQLHSIDGKNLSVHYDEPVATTSAVTISNYTVYGKASGTMTVTNAVLQDDDHTVVLYLDSSAGEFLVVGVSNVVSNTGTNYSTTATGYLNYLGTTSIGNTTNPVPVGEVISFYRDTFNLSASGSGIGSTNDRCHFVFQPAVGNFEVSTLVTRLDNTDPSALAGLMVRENSSPGSRSLGIYFTPLNAGSNQIVTTVRSATNASASALNAPVPWRALSWLRLTRTNNVFTVYYSSNSTSWTVAGSANLQFNLNTIVGAAATSNTNGVKTTAGFSSFNVDGAIPGANVVPTLSVAVVSNNLVAKWQRTPRDFAVQVTDGLDQQGTPGGTNAPAPWAFLLQPIYDTTITGTNVYMPTPGRYMTIPMDLLASKEMYVRLAQVEKVFPDPVDVKGGICLSGASFLANAAGATLCTDSVDAPTSVTLTNSAYVICMPTNVYQFTTENSDTAARTVMQLRNRISGLSYYLAACVGSTNAAYVANNYKASVTLPMSQSVSNYTFIVGSANGSPKKTPIRVDIRIK
jgi:regulation of enolase protein 1 (concanavalin A-like superfamily)